MEKTTSEHEVVGNNKGVDKVNLLLALMGAASGLLSLVIVALNEFDDPERLTIALSDTWPDEHSIVNIHKREVLVGDRWTLTLINPTQSAVVITSGEISARPAKDDSWGLSSPFTAMQSNSNGEDTVLPVPFILNPGEFKELRLSVEIPFPKATSDYISTIEHELDKEHGLWKLNNRMRDRWTIDAWGRTRDCEFFDNETTEMLGTSFACQAEGDAAYVWVKLKTAQGTEFMSLGAKQ